MARRANHEGSVYQRTDGLWVASIQVVGKRLYRYGKTHAEASQKLQQVLREHHTGTLTQPSRVTLADWVEQWLDSLTLRPSSEQTYRRVLAPIVQELGKQRLDKVTPLSLSVTISKLAQRGVGARRLQLAHGYLRSCLQRAVDLQVLTQNPMARVRRPVWKPQERRYWTVDQAHQFIVTARSSSMKWAPLFVVLVTCGLRVSEALALTSDDVDLNRGVVRIERAAVWDRSVCTVGPVKTKSARRVVSLPAVAREALTMSTDGVQEGAALFRTASGNPPTLSHLRESLLALCSRAGVPPINIHGLRHTAAALAYTASGDVHATQHRLGHSSAVTTMRIYSYLLHDDASTAAALDALLKPQRQKNRVVIKTPRASLTLRASTKPGKDARSA